MVFVPASMVGWLMVGLMASAIGSQFLSSSSYGLGRDIGIGALGAFVGGFAGSLGFQDQAIILASMTAAFVGAVLLTNLAGALPRGLAA